MKWPERYKTQPPTAIEKGGVRVNLAVNRFNPEEDGFFPVVDSNPNSTRACNGCPVRHSLSSFRSTALCIEDMQGSASEERIA